MDGKPYPKLLLTEGLIDNYEQGAVQNYAECMDGIIKGLSDQVDDLRTVLARTRKFIYSGPPRNKELQMMNSALSRCRGYGPDLTENEQVIVLQGEKIVALKGLLHRVMAHEDSFELAQEIRKELRMCDCFGTELHEEGCASRGSGGT